MASRYQKAKPDRQRPAPKHPSHQGALCEQCPLRFSQPVADDGPAAPLLAVVGEAPGREELDTGLPLVGKAGTFLADMLTDKGLARRDVLLANAVSCFPPGGDMKAFMQRAKKEHKAEHGGKVPFYSPIDCCRPRLMFNLGVPRCALCLKWDIIAGPYEDPRSLEAIRCACSKPKWVRPVYGRVKAVLAAGNAALESLRGSDGIKKKQMYVFENKERCR